MLVSVLPPELLVCPLLLDVCPLELLVPPPLPLLVPQPGGGLVDEFGDGGGQALLVSVLPEAAWTWLELAPFVLPLARAAPIGTVNARAKAAPNTSLNRRIFFPQLPFSI